VQRGRCRTCGAVIPKSYFYVEFVCALIGALVTARWGQALPEGVCEREGLLPLLLASTAAYSLYLNALTDIYSGYIFDLFALAPGAMGLLLRIGGGGQGLTDGLLGAALGYGIIACIILLSRGGMGWGDAHLMAGLGSILGWKMTGHRTLFRLSPRGILGVLLLVTGKAKRKDAIPLGPFLALGGIAAILCGPSFLAWFGITSEWPWNAL
jgi:leader peptidase (prepilin peptidase)/N-methyltransferase